MISAALQVANTMALLRMAAEVELLDAGVRADDITYGDYDRVPQLFVCGKLAWSCDWGRTQDGYELLPCWHAQWKKESA